MKKQIRRAWDFIWHDDSALSWIVNIIIAFIVIKYAVYPALGAILGTSFPIVAVVSGSMEHKVNPTCQSSNFFGSCKEFNTNEYGICGKKYNEKFEMDFDTYFETCGEWYEERGISKTDFESFPFKNGFNKGDIMILNGDDISVGDVMVFYGGKPNPIIHRVVKVEQDAGKTYYQTKGDHNEKSFGYPINEMEIEEERVIGRAIFRVPYLGWVRIAFAELVNLMR